MNPFENIKNKVNKKLHNQIPKKWKKIGDILIADFSNLGKNDIGEVASVYGEILRAKTVLQKNKINGELRKPKTTEILFGKDTETEIIEYGIKYRLDLSKVMWSPGNTGWRSILEGPERVGNFYKFDNPKTIIDYFAGIGYFTIQLAKSYPDADIISVDKNPESIKFLDENLKINDVTNVKVVNDDCRNIELKADVIHLGYISNTLEFLDHARKNLNDNGVAIFHEAYNNSWIGFKRRSEWGTIPPNFSNTMIENGFTVKKFERVKFYGPSKSHIIAFLQKI
jgi:tRNA wybutosine-synthesizing protein 2